MNPPKPEGLPAPRRSSGRPLPTTVLYGAPAVLVAGLAFGLCPRNPQGSTSGWMTHEVRPIDLRITALESGTIESASSIKVVSEVEGRPAILSLVPQGTAVQKGDVVVELDSSALRSLLTEQKIAVQKARNLHDKAETLIGVTRSQADSDVKTAELAVEFARLDLKRYLEADHPLRLRQLQSATALAEEEVRRTGVQLQKSEELHRDRYISESELEADRLRARRAEYSVENAKAQEQKLRDYDHPRDKRDWESKQAEAESALERTRKQAEATVQQAEKNLAAEKSTLDLEEGKLRRLEEQIEKCTMRAPQAGIVVYPIPEDNDRVELFIKQGTNISLRQHVFSIPDTDALQIRTSTHEALVNQVRRGLPARVWIDVLPDVELKGEVESISGEPDPEDWRRTTVKFYETKVKLHDRAEGMKLGMTARVEIKLEELRQVLALPVQAVVQKGDKGVCYVLRGGSPELCRLRLGKSSVEYVEVKEGVRAGERVLLSPDGVGIPQDVFEEPASAKPAEPSTPAEAPPPEEPVTEEEFSATLVGEGGSVAEVEYERQHRGETEVKREIDVKVAGGKAEETLEVRIGGVVIGSLTLDASGNGEVEFSTKTGTFPANFPAGVGPGTAVAVGAMFQGVLGTK
ncbi:MAG: HlyD family efflux transporter periplasmic adaptor subunit [Planctomycetes bacterium]|nr:HlyD family efflux transporter periplasmic adaptor subunit [Planctomycetota bacterium]